MIEANNKRQILNKKLGKRFITIGIIFFPLFASLYIVSLNSNKLIGSRIAVPILILAAFTLCLLVTGIVAVIKYKKESIKKLKKGFRILLNILATLYVTGAIFVISLLYMPFSDFRNWLIPTAITTMNHKHLATWFYDDYVIDYVMENNRVIEISEDTNPDLIKLTEPDFSKTMFANEFEKDIFTKEKGNDLYKIININRPGLKGKLAVIYDPSKVKVAPSKKMGNELATSDGQFLTDISKSNNAAIGINAGGFYDPDWNSTGGVPHGIVISNGKLLANNSKAVNAGGIIGFNKENKLVLARMTAEKAIASGIRDCVDFGPFLIVNGESSFIKGNGGWGEAPRTAIGQRKDGIVLLLVIDGRQTGSLGADMNDLAKIMLDYGAYNAANLDGGTSTAMTLNHEVISNPRNSNFQAKTRPIPNAWIVTK